MTWIQSSAWAYPALQVVHVLGIALLLGNLVLIEARVWGFAAQVPVVPLARLSLTLAVVGFSAAGLSGLLMFVGQAQELLANRAFTLKMLLICLAGCNAGWFHARNSLQLMDGTARLLLALSTLLWVATVVTGRWIAYI